MPHQIKGIGLIETVIGMGIFALLAVALLQVYTRTLTIGNSASTKIAVAAIATEQMEIIRNLPYSDVGIQNGIPPGKITHIQTITKDGYSFQVTTTIRNIDDPFDGTISSSPRDTAPADYKLVELGIACPNCKNYSTQYFNSFVSPKNLETATTNGALFVRVFDANGQPIQGADVHIVNEQANPDIIIDETTNSNGELQLVDIPPGSNAYAITVSKPNFSTDKTYAPNDPTAPNPTKPHATVAVQQVTQISFSIDAVSTVHLSTLNATCAGVASVEFSLKGTKIISTIPDVLKYSATHSTNGAGEKSISNLEWDTYSANIVSQEYDIAGTIPLLPVSLSPNSTQEVKVILVPHTSSSLLVTVKDLGTGLPLSGASVTLENSSPYSETQTTGRGFLRQTDWSGGDGQQNFTDQTKFFSSDGNIGTQNPQGEIKLKQIDTTYLEQGSLITSTFDTGSASNFYQLQWQPQDQPLQTGQDSIKFQIATNNDNETWSFIGPDGTQNSFYTLADHNISEVHNGNRYIRFKIVLATEDQQFSPNLAEFSFTFTSSCIPPGQVIYPALANGDFVLTVSKTGYAPFSEPIKIIDSWQQQVITLTPQ